MQLAYDVRPRTHQDFVAALAALEVVQGEIPLLQVGADGPVEDDDPLAEEIQERMSFIAESVPRLF